MKDYAPADIDRIMRDYLRDKMYRDMDKNWLVPEGTAMVKAPEPAKEFTPALEARISFEIYTPTGVVVTEPGDLIFADRNGVTVFIKPTR